MKIPVECSWCKKSFMKQQAWAKRTPRHFCCRRCSDFDRSQRLRSTTNLLTMMQKVRESRTPGVYRYGKRKGYIVKGKALEHRAIMESILGRALRSDEVVHHRNGNTLDNRPDNLEVMAWADHSSLHFKEYYANLSNRKQHSSIAKSWWETATPAQREARCASMRVPKPNAKKKKRGVHA